MAFAIQPVWLSGLYLSLTKKESFVILRLQTLPVTCQITKISSMPCENSHSYDERKFHILWRNEAPGVPRSLRSGNATERHGRLRITSGYRQRDSYQTVVTHPETITYPTTNSHRGRLDSTRQKLARDAGSPR